MSQDVKETAVAILAHFANFKLAGDRYVRGAVTSMRNRNERHINTSATSGNHRSRTGMGHPRVGGIRRYRRNRRRGQRPRRRVGDMSDVELQEELESRRRDRAKERERYARAMRVEKLNALESELGRLRVEISRMGGGGFAKGGGGGDGMRGSLRFKLGVTDGMGGGVPPPPPPLLHGGRGGGEQEVIDPERQKREKAERQKRREQKRKEREANKKPLTLADVIRSAGPNPMKRLKPKTPKPTLFDDPNVVHGFVTAKDDSASTEKASDDPEKEGGNNAQEGEKKSGEEAAKKKDAGEGNEKGKDEQVNGEEKESKSGNAEGKKEKHGAENSTDDRRKSGTVRTLFPDNEKEVSGNPEENKENAVTSEADEEKRKPIIVGNGTAENTNVNGQKSEATNGSDATEATAEATGPKEEQDVGENGKAEISNEHLASSRDTQEKDESISAKKPEKEAKTANGARTAHGMNGRAVKTTKSRRLSRDPVRIKKASEVSGPNEDTKENKDDNVAPVLTTQTSADTKVGSPTIRNLAKKKAALLAVRQRRRARKESASQLPPRNTEEPTGSKDDNVSKRASQTAKSADLSSLFAATSALSAVGVNTSSSAPDQ